MFVLVKSIAAPVSKQYNPISILLNRWCDSIRNLHKKSKYFKITLQINLCKLSVVINSKYTIKISHIGFYMDDREYDAYHKAPFISDRTRQIRTPVLRLHPAVTSQAKMKNWLHECQKWVSHMIGHFAHIYWGRTLIFNPMQDHDPSDISTKNILNPLKTMRVIIRTSTDGVG